MVVKATALTDEDILRIARVRVVESAAGTYTQVSLDTQLSIERKVIWMIHFIEFNFSNVYLLSEVAAGGTENVIAQVTRESKGSIIAGNDTDLVQQQKHAIGRSAAIGTDAGPLTLTSQAINRFDFPLPMPYAAQNIYVGLKGTHASSAHTIDVRIGYSIKTVTDQFFFRVASALVG